MASPHWIANEALICHAFNKDNSMMAISLNTNNVYILSVPKNAVEKFKLIDVLKEHSELVTGVDWSNSDQIVSCSADRNAYVWKKDSAGQWKPTLVSLQINRAALCVSWSPAGNKFAVGSGEKLISVCYFEKRQDWWVSKHIRKPICSTVTCVDWHPNNIILACGSSDYRVRVYSAYIKGTDAEEADSTWGAKSPFKTLLFEAYNGRGGWVHSVCFSANGEKLAWVSHDCSIGVADSTAGTDSSPALVMTLYHSFLPMTTCVWVANHTILAAGHDCRPVLFHYKDHSTGIIEGKEIDVKDDSRSSAKLTAMKKFQDIDRMATIDNASSRLSTLHQNSINEIRIFKGDRSKAVEVTTIGLDGQMIIWNLIKLSSQFQDLSIN